MSSFETGRTVAPVLAAQVPLGQTTALQNETVTALGQLRDHVLGNLSGLLTVVETP